LTLGSRGFVWRAVSTSRGKREERSFSPIDFFFFFFNCKRREKRIKAYNLATLTDPLQVNTALEVSRLNPEEPIG
jgi:hypothetical protein